MPSANNIDEELLALLDNKKAASCRSLPTPRQKLSRRGGSDHSRGGDRSVPPKFKYWANGIAERGRARAVNARGRTFRRPPDDRAGTPGPFRMRCLALFVAWACALLYPRIASRRDIRNRGRSRGGASPPRDARDGEAATGSRPPLGDPAWRGRGGVPFGTMVPPSEIDFAAQRRSRPGEERDSNCDDVLLYLPRASAGRGRAIEVELDGYLMAALLATYAGKAMVVLDPPAANADRGAVGWLDCPVDTFDKGAARGKGDLPRPGVDFPTGLSRVIRHPQWLSRGCPVPCQTTYDFSKWNDLREQHVQQVTCQNDNDRQAIVFAVSGEDARRHFESRWGEQVLEGTAAAAYGFAMRLGARGHEARTFAQLRTEGGVRDYASALMARSGVLRFQPWIAGDVKALIKSSKLPVHRPYVAVCVRGGDGPRTESGGRDGSATSNAIGIEDGRPLEFVPLYDYFRRRGVADCDGKARSVYVATNDPRRIQEEIDREASGANASNQKCLKVNFILSPIETTRLLDEHDKLDCRKLHRANVAAIAELMILAKSDTFVGELNSNLGRLVRIFRTVVNDFPGGKHDGSVLIRNTYNAF